MIEALGVQESRGERDDLYNRSFVNYNAGNNMILLGEEGHNRNGTSSG